MTAVFNSFGIVGAGAWGTAIGVALARAGRRVVLWARESEVVACIKEKSENQIYLPGIKLGAEITASSEMSDLAECDALVLASPAQHMREVCKAAAPFLANSIAPLIITAKGIESSTYNLMSEVVEKELPHHPVFVLSGPSFAKEVARNLPAALTLSGETSGDDLALSMLSSQLRLYTTDDVIGTQIGGAVKNVLAIACGIVAGRKMGENARAALITRGLAEIIRLGTALGCRPETLMGMSGLGDIVLTCSSEQSRNMSLGLALGRGMALDEALAASSGVTEGIATAAAALGLARKHGVEMPVVSAVDMILREQASIDGVISGLMSRPLRNETV